MSFHLREDGRDLWDQQLTSEDIVEAVREWLARKGRLPHDTDTVVAFEIERDGEIKATVKRG